MMGTDIFKNSCTNKKNQKNGGILWTDTRQHSWPKDQFSFDASPKKIIIKKDRNPTVHRNLWNSQRTDRCQRCWRYHLVHYLVSLFSVKEILTVRYWVTKIHPQYFSYVSRDCLISLCSRSCDLYSRDQVSHMTRLMEVIGWYWSRDWHMTDTVCTLNVMSSNTHTFIL